MAVALRLVLAAIFVGIGFFLLAQAGKAGPSIAAAGYLVVAAAAFGVGGILLAPSIAGWFGDLSSSIFFPARRLARVPPAYGPAEKLAKEGRYPEALAAYERILAAYPDEAKAFLEMTDIALLHLGDTELAETIHKRGMAALRDRPDTQAELRRAYEDALQTARQRATRLASPRQRVAVESEATPPPADGSNFN